MSPVFGPKTLLWKHILGKQITTFGRLAALVVSNYREFLCFFEQIRVATLDRAHWTPIPPEAECCLVVAVLCWLNCCVGRVGFWKFGHVFVRLKLSLIHI